MRTFVDRFANEHPRFDELGAAIEAGVRAGLSLEHAYRLAAVISPAKKRKARTISP